MQRREIPIHVFELAYATVSYEICSVAAATATILRGRRRHHASTFVAAVTTRSHNDIGPTFYHL